jgi:hypothetical protein
MAQASWLAEPTRWTEQQARAVLDRQERSGLSVQSFAAREGLSAARLYTWRSRLAQPKVSFVEVAAPSAPPTCIEVSLPNGVRVSVPQGSDVEFVVRLVSALAR